MNKGKFKLGLFIAYLCAMLNVAMVRPSEDAFVLLSADNSCLEGDQPILPSNIRCYVHTKHDGFDDHKYTAVDFRLSNEAPWNTVNVPIFFRKSMQTDYDGKVIAYVGSE